MSYTKDANGNIVKNSWWKKPEKTQPLPPLPPPIEEPKAPERSMEDYFELVVNNQTAIYQRLGKIEQDLAIIKDESVDEATEKFKALQQEIVEQIAELEEKKSAVKKGAKKK